MNKQFNWIWIHRRESWSAFENKIYLLHTTVPATATETATNQKIATQKLRFWTWDHIWSLVALFTLNVTHWKKNTPAKPLLLYARWFHAIANFINNLTRTTHNQFGFMTLLSSIIRLNWHFLRKYQRLGLIITKMQKIGIYRLLLLLNKKLYHELQITVNEEKKTHNPKET